MPALDVGQNSNLKFRSMETEHSPWLHDLGREAIID